MALIYMTDIPAPGRTIDFLEALAIEISVIHTLLEQGKAEGKPKQPKHAGEDDSVAVSATDR